MSLKDSMNSSLEYGLSHAIATHCAGTDITALAVSWLKEGLRPLQEGQSAMMYVTKPLLGSDSQRTDDWDFSLVNENT